MQQLAFEEGFFGFLALVPGLAASWRWVMHQSSYTAALITTLAPRYAVVMAERTAPGLYMCTQTHAGLSSRWESLTGWGQPGAPANAEIAWQPTGQHIHPR